MDTSLDLRGQAEPYRLGTLRVSLDCTTTVWEHPGHPANRPINENNIARLIKSYRARGVQRISPSNRLPALCTRADWDRFGLACRTSPATALPGVSPEVVSRLLSPAGLEPTHEMPLITSWPTIVGQPLTLLEGQHRIQALRRYVQSISTPTLAEELWWVCDLYDQGKWSRTRTCGRPDPLAEPF
jgi:hypothetical protein